jgi:ubiquinone/menaquinone biosynthesis C-methylase UbiE
LVCPRCNGGSLVPEADVADRRFDFGPVHCLGCGARFPVGEGMIDLVGERPLPKGFQRGMENAFIARSYERYVRPAFELLLTRGQFDRDSEYLVYKSLLGKPEMPVLDLGCGTGLFARKLCRDLGPDAEVIGLDVSKPMIEEAIALTREAGVSVDYVRAEVPTLPFHDKSVGAVLHAGGLHFILDAESLLAEVSRVLKPKGLYVASCLSTPSLLGPFHRVAGIHPRSEQQLRELVAQAGLVRFERVRVPPMVVFKAERP